MAKVQYRTAFGLIIDNDDPFKAKYPVYEPHIRIPEKWLDKLAELRVGCVARIVFLYMMPYMDWETKISFPTQRQLAEDAGLRLMQVQRGIVELEKNRIIRKDKLEVFDTKGRYHYQYQILL